jgi:hypothetical protein
MRMSDDGVSRSKQSLREVKADPTTRAGNENCVSDCRSHGYLNLIQAPTLSVTIAQESKVGPSWSAV